MADFVTELAAQQGKSPADVERDFFLHARPTSLLKRFETPEAVTAVTASPRSSGVNGAALRIDGGVVRAVG